jgi:DNA-binding MarR family transcriptional regulator
MSRPRSRSRSPSRGHECSPPPEDGRAPTTVELAEVLLGTAHAFKQWGNLCFSQAEPGLRHLSVPRARLLAVVSEAGQGRVQMGDLSAALGVTARNITTIVDGLEREGLLARRPDPDDRRAILLELTEKGRAHVEQVHQLQRDLAERMFAPLSDEERGTLYALLARLARRLAQTTEAGGKAGRNGRDEEPADWRA